MIFDQYPSDTFLSTCLLRIFSIHFSNCVFSLPLALSLSVMNNKEAYYLACDACGEHGGHLVPACKSCPDLLCTRCFKETLATGYKHAAKLDS